SPRLAESNNSGKTGEFAEAFHFGAGGQGTVLLHHLAHLHVLLQNHVDVLHRCAAALCDALAAFAVNEVVIITLLIGHGVDDRFDLFQLAFVHLGVFGNVLQRAHLGEHVHDLLERAHFANLSQLITEIFERKFGFAELALELHCGFFVNGLFGALDERKNVAHPENAGNDALGIEAFERIVFFAEADELDRRAADFADGKSSAAAGIAIEFRENDAGEAETFVKFSGGANGVLADHRVGDEENFARLQLLFEHGEFVHKLVVDVEAPGGVHDDYVAGGKLCFLDRTANNFEWLVGAGSRPDRGANCFGELGKLFASRRAVNVGRNDKRTVAVQREPFGKFAGGGGLTGALKADDHPDRRRARSKQRLGVFAKQRGQLVADGFDELTDGREVQ